MSKIRIIVFDVPAESGGALTILNEYYDKAVNHKDKNIQWIFVVSKPNLKSRENLKVLRYPWIKKSWFHRLYFDYFISPKLVKKYNVDEILSLQNLVIPRMKNIKQTVYVHQSLPFVDYKFRLKDNKKLWIYQNILGIKIKKSIKKANNVIVQTQWMKKLCITKTGVKSNKIEVRPPETNILIEKYFNNKAESFKIFFYPANGSIYKNHRIILEACKKLLDKGISDFKVIFTLDKNEDDYIKDLYSKVEKMKLPIDFIGYITREKVFELYTKSVLIFPSYIETFGLPILEAKSHKGIILASDCPFSREILNDYKSGYFFNPFDSDKLVELMENLIMERKE